MPEFVADHVFFREGNMMLWGGISSAGCTGMVAIMNRMSIHHYVSFIISRDLPHRYQQ